MSEASRRRKYFVLCVLFVLFETDWQSSLLLILVSAVLVFIVFDSWVLLMLSPVVVLLLEDEPSDLPDIEPVVSIR